MSKQQKSKTRIFSKTSQKKVLVLFFLVLAAFIFLFARLVWLIKNNETEYQKQVLSQRSYDSKTLPARRGDIVDSKGVKLATCEKVYNLVVDASVMTTKEGKYIEPTLTVLGQCFPQLDIAQIRSFVKADPSNQWHVFLKQLTFDEISEFLAIQSENKEVKGIWFEEEFRRVYPGGSLAADVIGFTRTDNHGLYGLEEFYNTELNGVDGRTYGYLDDDLNLQRTVKPAVDGYTIHSTLDSNVQSIVEKYLKKFNEEHKDHAHPGNGAENLGCIVMEVNTGNILAMASYPTFDLNDTKNVDALLGMVQVEQVDKENGYFEIKKTGKYINEELLASMTDEEVLTNLNYLWKNYCITSSYEPGSTFKPFTVAAALETDSISPDSYYECLGSWQVGPHNIHCHNRYGDGTISLKTAVAQSCNVAMMKIATTMGAEKFSKFQQAFNFGLKTNIDLAGEARTADFLRSADEMDPSDLATYSFGQNFNVTMIQLATGFCSLINGGYYYEPHMVSKITNSSGVTVKSIEPRILKQTISASTSELIREYCTAVVTEGTGKAARPAGYLIGGKTGTAQTYPREGNDFVVSFIGFAPVDDPQILVYVVVDRVNEYKQDNVGYAREIVRNIFTEVLPYENIFMTEELSAKEQKELEDRQLEITLQYGKALENPDQPEETQEETVQEKEPVWKSFPIDPATGCRKDPNTGELLDPDTGDPITATMKSIDF
ncbi:MAG: penicillin-binding protein 2 [Lachnospiraceae bacterium]|nr:penicillin-binding protein 2 [Lachnospiraceae bacterium]